MEEELANSGVTSIEGDNLKNLIEVDGRRLRSISGDPLRIFTLQGIELSSENGGEVIILPSPGVYIVIAGEKRVKLNIH